MQKTLLEEYEDACRGAGDDNCGEEQIRRVVDDFVERSSWLPETNVTKDQLLHAAAAYGVMSHDSHGSAPGDEAIFEVLAGFVAVRYYADRE